MLGHPCDTVLRSEHGGLWVDGTICSFSSPRLIVWPTLNAFSMKRPGFSARATSLPRSANPTIRLAAAGA
jgi:hypothetical protein